jgi:ABC-type nitrate/sulfonate/bicarbonate transport system substrate-binding protein
MPCGDGVSRPSRTWRINSVAIDESSVLTIFYGGYLARRSPRNHAAAPITKIMMTAGSASERDGVIYVAQDLGLFRKYGLDLTFVQVRNGPVAMSALSSGETQFHWGSVSGANLGAIAESADLVFVAGFINRLSGMFVTKPQIKTPAELKGKSVAVNSLSGGGWIFSMLMLDYWALSPERDRIQFRTLGEQAVMAQGVLNGAADAAFLGYTFGKMLQSKGFRVLADSEKLPIPYQGFGVIAKRSFINSAPAALGNLLRGLLDSGALKNAVGMSHRGCVLIDRSARRMDCAPN